MRKILLDCGTNLCQGLEEVSKTIGLNDDWDVYSFEVNPEVYKSIDLEKYPKVKFINKGVWIKDEFRELNVEILKGSLFDHIGSNPIFNIKEEVRHMHDVGLGGGTNIIDNINYRGDVGQNIKKYHSKVDCFDFSKFISDNFSKNDYIVIKMDIEGSEYEVLSKMFQDGTIDYVNELFIEWHDDLRFISSRFFIEQIRSKNIKLVNWK